MWEGDKLLILFNKFFKTTLSGPPTNICDGIEYIFTVQICISMHTQYIGSLLGHVFILKKFRRKKGKFSFGMFRPCYVHQKILIMETCDITSWPMMIMIRCVFTNGQVFFTEKCRRLKKTTRVFPQRNVKKHKKICSGPRRNSRRETLYFILRRFPKMQIFSRSFIIMSNQTSVQTKLSLEICLMRNHQISYFFLSYFLQLIFIPTMA